MAGGDNVKALAFFNAIRGIVVGGYMTIFPVYMKSLGYSMKSIGGILSVSSIILAFFLPFIGYLNDKYGPRKMIFFTTIILSIAQVIPAYSKSLFFLALSYSAFLFSFLAGQPARMSFLSASVGPERLGMAIGLTTGVFSASRTVGPALAGYVARYVGFYFIFMILFLFSILSLFIFYMISYPVNIRRRPRDPIESYKNLIKPPGGFKEVLVYVSLDRIAWTLWFPLLSAHLYASGYTEDIVGMLVTASGVAQTIILPFAGRMTDKIEAWKTLVISDLVGIIVAFLLSYPHPLERVVLAMVLLGLSIGVWIPGYNTLIARVAGGTGSSYAGANTVRSIVSAPFPYLGGKLYDSISPAAPFSLSMMLMATTILYALLVVRTQETQYSVSK